MNMLIDSKQNRIITIHGFMSTFRDWSAHKTNYPREICERISAITFVFLFKKAHNISKNQKSLVEILKPVLECLIAIWMVLIGMVLYLILPNTLGSETISNILLYLLIFFVGVDLATIKVQSLTLNHIKVPLLTIIALFIAAYLTTFILDRSFFELIVLGSGFSWFSLRSNNR